MKNRIDGKPFHLLSICQWEAHRCRDDKGGKQASAETIRSAGKPEPESERTDKNVSINR